MPILLCDYDGKPRLLVKLTDIRNITFGEMGINESSLDGPPVQDPDIWIPLHRNYWNGLLSKYGRECTDDMPVPTVSTDDCGEVDVVATPTITDRTCHGSYTKTTRPMIMCN